MYLGIFGDIAGRKNEFTHFYIKQYLCPKNKEGWKITPEQRTLLLEGLKVPHFQTVLNLWRTLVPEHVDGLLAFLDKSEYQFTDDTTMSIAVMDALLTNKRYPPFEEKYLYWGRKYLNVGYGGQFRKWLISANPKPYYSFGNGSAMRVSPVAIAGNSLKDSLRLAHLSALPTHSHPEGIRGAQAVAFAVYLAKQADTPGHEVGEFKNTLIKEVESKYFYDLSTPCEEIRKTYAFDSTCQGSVGQSIRCFIESRDGISAIENAISLGGDCDTMAMVAGCIAEAYYRIVPNWVYERVTDGLPDDMKEILEQFTDTYKHSVTIE